jgi:hypothetical protein
MLKPLWVGGLNSSMVIIGHSVCNEAVALSMLIIGNGCIFYKTRQYYFGIVLFFINNPANALIAMTSQY